MALVNGERCAAQLALMDAGFRSGSGCGAGHGAREDGDRYQVMTDTWDEDISAT